MCVCDSVCSVIFGVVCVCVLGRGSSEVMLQSCADSILDGASTVVLYV